MRKHWYLPIISLMLAACANKEAEETRQDDPHPIMVTNGARTDLVQLFLISPAIAPEKAALLRRYETIPPKVTKYVNLSAVTESCVVSLRAEFVDGTFLTVTDRDICRGAMEVVFERQVS